MKRYFLLITLLIGLICISCDIFDYDNDKDDFVIKITPAEAAIAAGEELLLQVKIKDVDDLAAMSVEIVFNAAVLELPEDPLIVGEDWGDNIISTSVSEMDRLNVAIGLIENSGENELEGEFTLFKFKILGKSAGETMVIIHNLNLYDEDGEPVDDFDEIKIENAVVSVQ